MPNKTEIEKRNNSPNCTLKIEPKESKYRLTSASREWISFWPRGTDLLPVRNFKWTVVGKDRRLLASPSEFCHGLLGCHGHNDENRVFFENEIQKEKEQILFAYVRITLRWGLEINTHTLSPINKMRLDLDWLPYITCPILA